LIKRRIKTFDEVANNFTSGCGATNIGYEDIYLKASVKIIISHDLINA
jgi:hypothetical protein